MNWKIFLLLFIRNVVRGIVLGIAALGLFDYRVAGQEGVVNGAYWGVILGLLGGIFSGITFLFRFWEQPGNYKIFPQYYWFVKKKRMKRRTYNPLVR